MTQEIGSPQQLAFDAAAFPVAERIERYRAIYGIGAEVAATGPAPSVKFQGWRLDRAILYERWLNDIGHVRPAANLARYGMSHWTVTLVLEGWVAVDLGMGLRQIAPGEVLFVDTKTAFRNDARHAHIATLSIAEDRLEEILGPMSGLHGSVIAAREAQLYDQFIRSLLATLPTLHSAALPALTSTLGMILRAALDIGRQTSIGVSANLQTLRLAAFRKLVDGRLGDVGFGTEAAIAESGLSRASLYRLLHPYGGLAAYLRNRRLDYLRRALSDPDERRGLSVLAREAGFRDESQASRAFTVRFGVRPSAYRSAVTGTAATDARFRIWQDDLR